LVLYFAAAREAAGTGTESLDLDRPARAGAILGRLVAAHPRLGALGGSLRMAVNRQIAGDDDLVSPGDELAVLPPVAGG
jgi:MoaE-MoaD fusion protein